MIMTFQVAGELRVVKEVARGQVLQSLFCSWSERVKVYYYGTPSQ